MRLSGFNLPLERLSATSLGTFNACPEQFRRKYLLREAEGLSGERFVGGVMHDAIQLMFNPAFITEDVPEHAPDRAIHKAWEDKIEEEGRDPDWHDTDAAEMFRRSKQMLKTYWPIASQQSIVKVEERFEEVIAGVSVVGYIDRELTDRILEVKTANAKVSKPKPRWALQGRLYGLVSALPIEWHIITRQATPKVYTASEAPELYVPRFNPDVTIKLIQDSVFLMNDLYARYGADSPWPLDGVHGDWTCGYCSFKKRCMAWV